MCRGRCHTKKNYLKQIMQQWYFTHQIAESVRDERLGSTKECAVRSMRCTMGAHNVSWPSICDAVECADSFLFSLHRPGGVGPVKLAVNASQAQFAILDISSCGPYFEAVDIHVKANKNALSSTEILSYDLPLGFH